MGMEANMNLQQGWTRSAAVRRIFTGHRRLSRHFQASAGVTSTTCQSSSSFFKSTPKLYRVNCRQATALCCFEQAKWQCAGAY